MSIKPLDDRYIPSRTVQENFFFFNEKVIRRVNRKHWNRAVELIETKRCPVVRCTESRKEGLVVNRKHKHLYAFWIEIRQSLLRHDWNSVCVLMDTLLLKTPTIFKTHRVLLNKILAVLLLNSPQANPNLFEDFCNMVLGITGVETSVFFNTIRQIPKELPRGFVTQGGAQTALLVRDKFGKRKSNSYVNTSEKARFKAILLKSEPEKISEEEVMEECV